MVLFCADDAQKKRQGTPSLIIKLFIVNKTFRIRLKYLYGEP